MKKEEITKMGIVESHDNNESRCISVQIKIFGRKRRGIELKHTIANTNKHNSHKYLYVSRKKRKK